MEVSFDKQQYSIDESTSEEIDYFDIKTPKVVIEGEEVYWCPHMWDWRLINHKEQMEKRYKNCMKTIYFNEKLFLVEKKVMRKHFKDGKLVDVCLLPIGIYVYWDINSEQWDFLGYK